MTSNVEVQVSSDYTGETDEYNKRDINSFHVPQHSSDWIRSLKSLDSVSGDDIDHLLQYLDKRSGEADENFEGDRSIRSPLGTMRCKL